MNEAQIVGQATAGEAKHCRKQLETLIKTLNRSSFDVGILLHKIRSNGYYEGYTTFSEYVATLEMKPRKAQYLRRIAEVMEAVGLTRDEYEPAGINKLRLISSLGGQPFDINALWTNPETKEVAAIKDYITWLVKDAGVLSVDDIEKHVRVLKGLTGENDLVWANFHITRSVRDTAVEPAKELVRRNLGSAGKDEEGVAKDATDGACLEVLCVEYLNNPANNTFPEA